MLKLAQGLGLDLAHALASDVEAAAHFFEGVLVGADAKAHADHALFAGGEGGKDVGGDVFEVALYRGRWASRLCPR